MKRFAAILLVTALLLPMLCVGAYAAAPELVSESAIVMCAETGQVLYEKDPDSRQFPASITKILTGLVALKYGNPSDVLTFSQEGFKSVPRDSTHIALAPEETLTLEDALYAVAVVSANDAAAAIAEGVAGSQEAFAEIMNREAQAAGAVSSNFVNPNGLPDENHYTTARDMAMITKAALEVPGFQTIFSAVFHEMAPTNKKEAMWLESKNKFIDGERPIQGLLCSKTGWTKAAQGTLVTVTKQDNMTLIVVVLKCLRQDDKYTDTQKLLEYCRKNYEMRRLNREVIAEKMRKQGLPESLTPIADTAITAVLPSGVALPDIFLAAGQDLGHITQAGTVDVSLCVSNVGAPPETYATQTLTLERADIRPAETEPVILPETEETLQPTESFGETILSANGWILAIMAGLGVYSVLVLLFTALHRKKRKATRSRIRRAKVQGNLTQIRREERIAPEAGKDGWENPFV